MQRIWPVVYCSGGDQLTTLEKVKPRAEGAGTPDLRASACGKMRRPMKRGKNEALSRHVGSVCEGVDAC
eukprot:2866368-Pleurochrysis_carterae.AAC.1